MLIIARTFVHFHVDHFVFVIVAMAIIVARLTAFALCIILLLHTLVFCSSILEPNFNLHSRKKEEKRHKPKLKSIHVKGAFHNAPTERHIVFDKIKTIKAIGLIKCSRITRACIWLLIRLCTRAMTTFHRPTANYLFIYQAIWRYFATTAIDRTIGHHPYHWRARPRIHPPLNCVRWFLALGKWCRRSNENDTLLWGEFINGIDSIPCSDNNGSVVYVPTGANQFRCMKVDKKRKE